MVLTRGLLQPFFTSSIFDLVFFTHDTQNGPKTESVKTIHAAQPPFCALPVQCTVCVSVQYLAAYCLYVKDVYLAAYPLYVWGVYLAACCLYV